MSFQARSGWAKAAVVGSFAWLAGCASVQSTYLAQPLDPRGQLSGQRETSSGLVISGEEEQHYASDHFGLVEVTFENQSPDWVHIETMTLDFGSAPQNQAVSIPEGDDIGAWYLATIQRNDIRDTNAATALATLLFAGDAIALVGGANGRREAKLAGLVMATGATTAGVVDAQTERVARAGRAEPLPGSHLLDVPFGVPPGLFAKKWVLLQTRASAPCIRRLLLDYQVASRGRERVVLTFRREHDLSDWQRKACTPPPGAFNSSAGAGYLR